MILPHMKESTTLTDRPDHTKSIDDGADEATINIGAAGASARLNAAEAARTKTQSETKVLPGAEAEAQAQADEARIRAEEKAARQKALGTVQITDDDVALPPPERAPNDKFLGSAGLFLLRLALVAVLGVRGVQILSDTDGTTFWLTDHYVPYATIVVWALGIGLIVIAAMLLLGFGVRLAGILTAVLAIAVIVWVRWGYTNIFVQGEAGFIGDLDLLVAGAGAALAFLGSGGWAIDAAMRFDRAKRKQYQ